MFGSALVLVQSVFAVYHCDSYCKATHYLNETAQVFIIGLLAVEKYENFRPVLDTYCDKLFHASTVHAYVTSTCPEPLTQPDNLYNQDTFMVFQTDINRPLK